MASVTEQIPPEVTSPDFAPWFENYVREQGQLTPDRRIVLPTFQLHLWLSTNPRPDGWDVIPLMIAAPYSLVFARAVIRSDVDVPASPIVYTEIDIRTREKSLLPGGAWTTNVGLEQRVWKDIYTVKAAGSRPQITKGDPVDLWYRHVDNSPSGEEHGEVTMVALVEAFIGTEWFKI